MIEMEAIKKSFEKVKQDINDLANYILELKKDIEKINKEIEEIKRTFFLQHISNTFPTDKIENSKFLGDKPYFSSSTGNRGVPTLLRHSYDTTTSQENKDFERREIINIELDKAISKYKKELINRFKTLTRKEFEIFSLIYSLQESIDVTYKILAEKTGLAPSSVRDLVNRLIIKGIPIEKRKNINREIILKIPDELKKISNLEALEKVVNYYGFNR